MRDKKKMMIIAALAVVMIAVGVFQFSGGGSAPAPAKTAEKSSSSVRHSESAPKPDGMTPIEKPGNGDNPSSATPQAAKPNSGEVALNELPERDPFDGREWQPTPDSGKKPVTTQIAQPKPLSGAKLGVFDPKVGALPPAGGGVVGPIGPGATPSMPKLDPNAFTYSVSGVVDGDRPMAVFVDDKGNQQLVTVGSSFNGGDTQLVSVARGKVTVRHHGKTLTMSVGANPK